MNVAATPRSPSRLVCRSLREAVRKTASIAIVRSLAVGTLLLVLGLPSPAVSQIEVYHPGETYDSLQAGHDAYLNAEALRRAAISRQLQVQEQIQLDNTWANPADKYSPIRPDSFGPIRPRARAGNGQEVHALARPDRRAYQDRPGLPSSEPWLRASNDVFGTPYYGVVRQPTGYVKIWTGPQSYIYKPTYASPPMDTRPSPPVAAGFTLGPSRSGGSRRMLPGSATMASPSTPVPPPPTPGLGIKPLPAPPAGAIHPPTAREL